MEDWKSAREEDDLEDIVPPMNHPNHGNTDRIDQSQEHDNGVQQEARRSSGTGRSRRGSSSNRPRLSIVETEDDWEEQDAALKNAKETAYTLLEVVIGHIYHIVIIFHAYKYKLHILS